MNAPVPATSGTIMLIDDEPENLNVLGELLRQAGWGVRAFTRGESALAAARAERPDLVLLDIRMPGQDGYEVCRRFKAVERLHAVPIIFISALAATEDIAAGFACGGVDYITKPFRGPELLARVRTHVDLRRAYAQLAEQHAQLNKLEQHRDTLVHMLVHDMRSPLYVLMGHLQLIEKLGSGNLGAEDLESLRAALHGARLLGRMVSTMVDVSRMESAAIPLHLTAVSVQDLFQAALPQAWTPASHNTIAERIAGACPTLLCDAELSARIVANLLANALKFTPVQGTVEFGAAPAAGGVRLWVRDQGPGIAAHQHAHIFEKFGVAEQPKGQRPASSGLGLAFCKLAVEAQGGTIGVESAPGQGSTFWFTLPAVTAAAPQGAAQA